MKERILILAALACLALPLVSGCGNNHAAAAKEAERQWGDEALQRRDAMIEKIKAMHKRTNGDYSQLTPEERSELLAFTLNNENNARRAFSEIGGQAMSAAGAAKTP